MHILFLTRLFYPHIGGVETHVLKISEILLKKGHKVTVITERYDPSLSEKEIYNRITIYRIPITRCEKQKKFIIWNWLRKNRMIIKEAEVVHCHDVFFWYLPFKLFYLKKLVFTTFHGYETTFPPSKNAIRIRKISEKLSNGNICVGDYIEKWYGTKPTDVTYGGVEASSKLNKFAVKQNSILFLGRLEQDNGIDQYLKALDTLEQEKVTFTFSVAGDGKQRKKAEKYGKVLGFIHPEEVIVRNSIIFSSSYLSLLEALIHKKIVIATYSNQLKEDYLKMSPFSKFILIAKNNNDLADIIKASMKTPWKYTTMTEKGQAWARYQTWDKVTRQYLKLWEK